MAPVTVVLEWLLIQAPYERQAGETMMEFQPPRQ